MKPLTRAVVFLLACLLPASVFASAYNGRPKLVVIVVVDQLRGDLLERYRDRLSPGGFRLFLDRGAWFSECYYDYVNTDTAAGHATLGTGAYTSEHGILRDDWWDPVLKKTITSVEDQATRLLGLPTVKKGASPHNLLASTLGDELKLATGGKARVFGVSLKDRAAILPVGFAADAAYWIDKTTGLWVSSSYYMRDLPPWLARFNGERHNQKYLNLEWKDAQGNVLRTTAPGQTWSNGDPLDYYETVARTPFANDYTLELVRALIENEKLGSGPATDLLVVSFSAFDVLQHRVGTESPQMEEMMIALDRQLAEFFTYLGNQFGLANVWMALSADHGVAPLAEDAKKLRIPAANLDISRLMPDLNATLAARLGAGEYVKHIEWPMFFMSPDAFRAVKMNEEEAERLVAETAMAKVAGMRGYVTRAQIQQGLLPPGELARRYAHSYSSNAGWYVHLIPPPFWYAHTWTRDPGGTSHQTLYNYDAHVPVAFFGLPFRTGTYRGACEAVDLATTLAALLGVNRPTHAIGRVLTEALAAPLTEGR